MISTSSPSSRVLCPKLQLSLVALLLGVACSANSDKPDAKEDAGKTDPGADSAPAGSEPAADTGGDFTPLPGQETEGEVTSGGANTSPIVDTSNPISVSTGDGGIFEVWCGSQLCACSDGIDNDGDGVADGFDSECTGPFDNDESSFATGIPGDNRDPKWQDCFFDGNSGAGDDGCRYHTECLTGDRPADDKSCVLTEQCVEFCQPLTPPGCDCFGCCEVAHGGSTVNVMLSATCSIENLDDEDACPRCVPTDSCANECGECELCLGQTLADLPASCWSGGTPDGGVPNPTPGVDGGTPPGETGDPTTPSDPGEPVNVCDNGAACTTSTECEVGDYCRLGCCVPFKSTIR